MKQLNITRILLVLLLNMAGITAAAHDIEVAKVLPFQNIDPDFAS